MCAASHIATRRLGSADIPAIARVHRAAFPDSGVSVLGQAVTEHYYRWQVQQSRWPAIIGADASSQLIGFCFMAETFGSMAGFLRARPLPVVAALMARPWVAWALRSQIAAAIPDVRSRRHSRTATARPVEDRPALWVHAIAVDPRQQGRGIGQHLMREAELFARDQGYQDMLLAVHTRNTRAIHAYEAVGWVRVPDPANWRGRMWKSVGI
jgi:ribosomal protein S18 acetylase RimI-like enzyme